MCCCFWCNRNRVHPPEDTVTNTPKSFYKQINARDLQSRLWDWIPHRQTPKSENRVWVLLLLRNFICLLQKSLLKHFALTYIQTHPSLSTVIATLNNLIPWILFRSILGWSNLINKHLSRSRAVTHQSMFYPSTHSPFRISPFCSVNSIKSCQRNL